MAAPDPFAELLACPRCDAPLTEAENARSCGACKVDFPLLDEIPFLFAEPRAALGEWRARLQMELQRLDRETQQLAAELDAADLLPLTRQRLELLQDAHRHHRTALAALLQPITNAQAPAALETYLALRTRLPPDQGLQTYFANVHRDWCWGDEENQVALDLISDRLGADARNGRILILGAGGGRLAYDLHTQLTPALTVALDFNPLLTLIARRVCRGETLGLYEFPLAPRDIESAAILRNLAAPAPARPGLEFVIGDVMRAPFGEASFDAVITPWLVDILPATLAEFAPIVNGLLRPGGRWVNFGSLAFNHAEPAQCLSREEALATVATAGFAAPAVREDEIPYMCCPASRQRRLEQVVTFGAVKDRDVARTARHSALPEWLVTGQEPVPSLPSFQTQAASTRIFAFVMGMIDGKRSIREMAELMENQRLMSREEAEPTIRAFLVKMYDASRHKLGTDANSY